MVKQIQTNRSGFFLSLYVEERDAPDLPKGIMQRIMKNLMENPFSQVVQMDFNRKDKWARISIDEIEKYLEQSEDISIVLRNTNSPALSCSLAINKYYHTININLAPQHQVEKNIDLMVEYTSKLSELFPNFLVANASCDSFEISNFYAANDLPYLPPCFNGVLSWFNLLPASTYEMYYRKQDLLKGPFFKVFELDNGSIGWLSYENPYDFTSQEVANKIAEITLYLDKIKFQL